MADRAKRLNHEEHEEREGKKKAGSVGFDELSSRVLGCAIEVHRQLGPGLLESAYRTCLAHELRSAGLRLVSEKSVGLSYKGVELDCGFRLDLLVEDSLIVELKTVDNLLPIHSAQLLTYMKLAKLKIGLLINFQTRVLRDGIKRLVL
jgi:GxxExxY protein